MNRPAMASSRIAIATATTLDSQARSRGVSSRDRRHINAINAARHNTVSGDSV